MRINETFGDGHKFSRAQEVRRWQDTSKATMNKAMKEIQALVISAQGLDHLIGPSTGTRGAAPRQRVRDGSDRLSSREVQGAIKSGLGLRKKERVGVHPRTTWRMKALQFRQYGGRRDFREGKIGSL
jgi:hypothetical protein